MDKLIYFDYAATTPVRPEAVEAMVDALGQFGNPSSRYGYARQAAQQVKEGREPQRLAAPPPNCSSPPAAPRATTGRSGGGWS